MIIQLKILKDQIKKKNLKFICKNSGKKCLIMIKVHFIDKNTQYLIENFEIYLKICNFGL